MSDYNEATELSSSVSNAYAAAAPYLSDHSWVMEFLLRNKDMDRTPFIDLIEESIRTNLPPRSTDLKILLNAMNSAKSIPPGCDFANIVKLKTSTSCRGLHH